MVIARRVPQNEDLRELLANRRALCVYDTTLQDAEVLHALGEQTSARFLVHFYTLHFVEDWRYDLWLKRLQLICPRSTMRYRDEIHCQCADTRIVAALRQAANDSVTSPTGLFDTLHIRRGDFQYAKSKYRPPTCMKKLCYNTQQSAWKDD